MELEEKDEWGEKAVMLQNSSIQLIHTKCLLLRLFQELNLYRSFEIYISIKICTVALIL